MRHAGNEAVASPQRARQFWRPLACTGTLVRALLERSGKRPLARGCPKGLPTGVPGPSTALPSEVNKANLEGAMWPSSKQCCRKRETEAAVSVS
eukprot:365784-Chlamydomonas_euryale.AAC.3